MKRLILKCTALLLCIGCILYVVGLSYMQTTTYQNLERTEGTDVFRTMPESIEIAVFGPSHGREDFRYSPDGYSFFNFSLSSQTPQYDAALLRQYQDRISPGALIVLTVTPLSPYWTDSPSAFREKQSRYYRVLDAKNIVDVDRVQYYKERFSPLLIYRFEDIVSAFFMPLPLQAAADEDYRRNQFSAEGIPGGQAGIRNRHLPLIEPVFPEVNPVMWDAYHEILSMCQDNGWNAILTTPPYLPEYLACFPDGMYDTFTARVDELVQEYGVLYLDYSHSEEYVGRYELFMDIDHLNLDGAAIFNAQFFSDIRALGLLR